MRDLTIKVVIVSNTFHSLEGAGTSFTAFYIARYLRLKGLDVSVLSTHTRPIKEFRDGLELRAFKENIVPTLSFPMFKYILQSRSDAYIFLGPSFVLPLIRQRNVILIPQWHKAFICNNILTDIFTHFLRSIQLITIKISQPKVICYTNEERSLLHSYARNIDVKPLGLDFKRDLCQFINSMRSECTARSYTNLLYVGRVVNHKFPLFFLDVLQVIDKELNGKFIINVVGPSDKHYLDELKAKLKHYSFRDKVIFVGGVNEEQLASYFLNSDVFVFPSLSESFGYTIVEALYSGLPIVASRTGIVPFLEANGLAMGVEYGDVQDFATKILECVHEKEVLRKKLRAQHSTIERIFNMDNFSDFVLTKVGGKHY